MNPKKEVNQSSEVPVKQDSRRNRRRRR